MSDPAGKRPPARPQTSADEHGLTPRERRRAFLACLARMSEQERVRAARHEFGCWQRTVWAGRYPEEVPLVHGEVEWIVGVDISTGPTVDA